MTTIAKVAAKVPTDLVGLSELAEVYEGVGLRTVRRLVYEGWVASYKVGGKRLVSRAEFAEYLAGSRKEPATRP